MILAKIYKKKHIKTFLFSLLSCILCYRIYTYALADQSIHIQYDSFFSLKTADLLACHATEFYTYKSLSCLFTDLKSIMPFLAKVTRRWLPSKKIEYTFFSQEPLAKLKN